MMKKIFGWLLLILSVLVIISMIVNNHILWFIVDILVIAGCGFSGVFLLIEKK